MAVDKLVDSTLLDGYFEDIADAIRGKNGSSDTYTPAQMPQAITDIPSGGGGGPVEEKDVNFIDYDGTIVYSYTADEFLELTEMPANPLHDGLTAQGWNWTLSEAKTYVQTCGILVVGQNYITDDEKTRVYITLGDNQLDIQLGIGLNGSATIDWGDNTTQTIQGSNVSTVIYTSHSYSYTGSYVISIAVPSGSEARITSSARSNLIVKNSSLSAYENEAYRASITKVELGKNMSLNTYAFAYCYALRSISIPKTTIIDGYNGSMFYCCYSLTGIVLPVSITTIWRYVFTSCRSLNYVSIPPTVYQLYGNTFQTSAIKMITIGDLTYVDTGIFTSCETLRKVSIKSFNSTSYTSIQSTFGYCSSLEELDLSRTTLKTLTYANSNNFSLKKIKLPSSLTSISTQNFYSCYSLNIIDIPENVTTIGIQAFYNCYGLTEIHFRSTTPPTISSSNAFNNVPTSCKIYVPAGSLSDYTSATNYPSASTYTYIEE